MWNGYFNRLGGRFPQSRTGANRREFHQFQYLSFEPRFLLASLISSTDGMWSETSLTSLPSPQAEPLIPLKNFGLYQLSSQPLKETLKRAPLEFQPGYVDQKVVITVPRPDSTFAQFRVVESPIMEAELAAEFPEFKTYRGVGIDTTTDTIRFDWTLHGFRAQVLSPNGNYYIDPYFKGQTELYSSYFRSSVVQDDLAEDRKIFGCGCGCGSCPTCGNDTSLIQPMNEDSGIQPLSTFGNQLRTFRLANAATGEYTQFWGGTVAQGQAAIVTAINRVTGIYENDLGIRLVLVNNNSSLVFTNPNTDPYSNNNVSAMLSQNQTTVDSIIGNANYDVGHVFGTGAGGVASFGVVGVAGQKARGVTGLPNPSGDPFYVDYVAHEIGHQFRASHTFNGNVGSCGGNRSANSAFEPGSGTSIMAYAGICGADNVQFNSDPFFHSHSIDQIRAFITTGAAANVGTTTNTGNSIPTVNTPTGFVIPARTPFELTASGSDPDGNQSLTYSWEQRNLGPAVSLTTADNGQSPIFRSYNPTNNPTRVFPRLQNLLNNTVPTGEKLPTTNWQSMNFRVVVRDNASGGGGVNFANMSMQVVDTGVGFRITSQNSPTTWLGNSSQTITWNVAGTTGNGINANQVDIWLSTDGGLNYSTLLADGVANNGAFTVTVPNLTTNQARIKVKATGNVFFDINDVNLTINATTSVVGGFIYHRGSSFANISVQAALDTGKIVALETATPQTLSFANMINTNRGINGLVFDIENLPASTLTASDFQFQISPQGAFNEAANPVTSWAAAPNPLAISVSTGAIKRVVLQWTDNVIANRWLRVTLNANANTGLQQPQSYYVGHLAGETTGVGNDGIYRVTTADAVQIANSVSPISVPVSNVLDLNKDGVVSVADVLVSTPQIGFASLRNITIGSNSNRPAMFLASVTPEERNAKPHFSSRLVPPLNFERIVPMRGEGGYAWIWQSSIVPPMDTPPVQTARPAGAQDKGSDQSMPITRQRSEFILDLANRALSAQEIQPLEPVDSTQQSATTGEKGNPLKDQLFSDHRFIRQLSTS